MFAAFLIAILNMWRGRGDDIEPRLNKIGFFVFSFAAIILFNNFSVIDNYITIAKFVIIFGFVFCIGTGEMMQAINGKQQKIKWQTFLIYWFISKITPLYGRFCGVLFNTIIGGLQSLTLFVINFSWLNLIFLLNGIIIYLAGVFCRYYLKAEGKSWQLSEYILGLFWAIAVIKG